VPSPRCAVSAVQRPRAVGGELGGASSIDIQHYAWLARSFGRTDYLLLSAEDLTAIGEAGTYVSKYPGTHLFREGEPSTAAYVIQKGTVELHRGSRANSLVVGRAGAGSVIGDIAMFRSEPYIQSARAVDAVTALRLDRDRLLPVLLERPVIALRWLVAGLSQLERTQRRVLGLMHRSVLEQVAGLLLDEVDARGEIHLSQAAIAKLLGASRQSVNEALAELRMRGAVETGYRLIRLIDREAAAATATHG
jgi:CRP/FNR family transcriptional regulator, cAMP and macrophage regulator